MRLIFSIIICFSTLGFYTGALADTKVTKSLIDEQKTLALIRGVESKVVEWRRDIHAHPELGNREFRTAGLIADHLRSLGMEVRTEVAHTGVVGILRGKSASPMVALRADMDALPVTERTRLPFASQVTTQ